MTAQINKSLDFTDRFVNRHIGSSAEEIDEMLKFLNFSSIDELVSATVPKQIRTKKPLAFESIPAKGRTEAEVIEELREIAEQNEIWRSFIGTGYYRSITPPVILRNIIENPGWYTQYTPYQAEIAQGRLEALLNFQTMIRDLTALEVGNASMLDEATAAAEAMNMCFNLKGRDKTKAFFVSELCHPQTIAVVQTRAEPLGIEIIVGNHEKFGFEKPIFGVLVQYPATDGVVFDYSAFIDRAHTADALAVVAADLLSLTLLKAPGEFGADIAIGSTQRFGSPLGYGGPHAAYMVTKDAYKRQMPGRIVGISRDADGKPAIRLALQTREQHIRREKATSNICTAQVLLAEVASMYAIYHGPKGLKKIAERIYLMTAVLANGLKRLGFDKVGQMPFFDTIKVSASKDKVSEILKNAKAKRINLRIFDATSVSVSLDEETTIRDLEDLFSIFACAKKTGFSVDEILTGTKAEIESKHDRKSRYLTASVFNSYHSETEMLRYLTRLQSRDLSLTTSMTALGSCTMKLNPTASMMPITWSGFASIHPFVPLEQAKGYQLLINKLEGMFAEITGFKAVSLQPNAGSQGEYSGLLVIRKFHQTRGEGARTVCLIPQSAHGTNPASAAMAGMEIVIVACDSKGNVDVNDLKSKAEQYKDKLACLMVTYPSTHGVFEEAITEICKIIHDNGGQVYMDGANMNAQVGLSRPAEFGADVCHLNLHKTFAMPHGGGGPGIGPIAVQAHLSQFLPTNPLIQLGSGNSIGSVCGAMWGSANLLPISYAYITMMGAEGLTKATQVAILNANYVAKKLNPHYPVLYRGIEGMVAHECIVDLRQVKAKTGVEVEDAAKRLMDYGFHAPTVSFPVPGTMMIEPTESESKAELDRFCDAMISIRAEIAEIEKGHGDQKNNLLKNAPHTAEQVVKTEWNRPYSRERAVYPSKWSKENKFWPPVSRIDSVYGDRNLVAAIPSGT